MSGGQPILTPGVNRPAKHQNRTWTVVDRPPCAAIAWTRPPWRAMLSAVTTRGGPVGLQDIRDSQNRLALHNAAVTHPEPRRAMKRTIAAAAITLAAILTFGVPAGAASHPRRAALKNFAAQIRQGLNLCTVDAQDTQIELGLVINAGNSASQSDLDQLDSADKQAQTNCDEAKNDAVLNLGELSVPANIAYIHSLTDVGTEATIWAQDTGHVLNDIQKLVESNSSNPTGLSSQLQTDVATADGDAGVIRAAVNHAASRTGLAPQGSSYGGLGLVTWSTS
jgi:hypothetical protein